jgi:large subunit ribosomal protein L32
LINLNIIMAVPKRKTTVSKRNKRRSHHKISNMNVVEDKKTGEYRISHHIDLKTGFYNGKKILDI